MSAAGGALRLREVTDAAGLRRLAETWGAVESASETRSPFLTHAWATAWWEELGDGHELWVLVLEDDAGPVAIAPFCRSRRRMGPLPYRSIELLGTGRLPFLGMGLADRADLLLARRRREAARRILEHLHRAEGSWDVADLRFVPEGSTTLRVLREMADDDGVQLLPCSVSPYVPLTAAAASADGRPRWLRRALRKLEAAGPVEVALGLDPHHDPAAALAAAFEVARASWKGAHGTALLSHAGAAGLFRRLASRSRAETGLSLALLTVAGAPAAYELCFRHGPALYSYDGCYRAALAPASPGSVLTALLVERARREGLEEYDLLRGDEAHKRRWRPRLRRETQALVFSPRARGRRLLLAGFLGKSRWRGNARLVAAHNRWVGRIQRLVGP